MTEQTVETAETVDQNLNAKPQARQPWKLRLRLAAVALLLTAAVTPSALNYLVPKGAASLPGVTARVGWYLQGGQLKADLHTLAAALQYLAASDAELPIANNPANATVAGSAAPDAPKAATTL